MNKKWLLSLLAAAACIAGTLGLTACDENETNHEHNWSAWSVIEAPTSTAEGKATRTCSGSGDCGAAAADKEYTLPVLTSTEYTLTGNTATCEAVGTATYTYSKGGVTVSFTAPTNVIGHNYGTTYTYEDETGHWQICANNSAHTTTKEAHDEGGTDGACSKCGYTAPAPAHEHDWNDWTLDGENKPTAEQTGKAIRTCKNADCDAGASDKEYTLPVLTSEDYSKSADSATCTEAGEVTYTYNKDGVNVSFAVATEATGHAYGTEYTYEDETGHWQICANNSAHTTTKEAHDEDGTDGACSKCGYTKPVHVHDWNDWTLDGEDKPTAEQTGKVTRTCKNADCDAEESEKEYTLPELTSEDYVKTNDGAGCETEGIATYTYNKDGVSVSFTAASPAKGHSVQILKAVPATCTVDGLTEGKKCSVCEETLVPQDTVEATGHTEETVAAVEATCYDEGLTEGKICSVCQTVLEEQKVTPANGHSLSPLAPALNETDKTVSQRCTVCNKTIVYNYDNAVLDAAGNTVAAASSLHTGEYGANGVYYVSQSTTNPYLSYTFEEAGTYTIYWAMLNSGTFNLTVATFGTTSKAFVSSNSLQKANIPEGFVLEGYYKGSGTLQYYVPNEDGTQSTVTVTEKGEYVRLTKDNLGSASSLTITNLIPVKLTFNADANSTLKFRHTASDEGRCFLIGINEEPVIAAEYCAVGEGDYSIKDTELEFMPVTAETAGTYTFMAEAGIFELYVNGDLYSDGTKDCFGYIDFYDRYLTVTLEEGNVVTVKKISGRASQNTFTISEDEIPEPVPTYTALHLGDQTITLISKYIAVGVYEDDPEQKFYSFTADESGYFNISVSDDIKVSTLILVEKHRYTFVFDVDNMNSHSGVFYAEAGKKVIIAFVGNSSEEFNVNIVSCEEPVTTLEVNEQLESIAFSGYETIIKITVGDSVAAGTYRISFEDVSLNLFRSYIYFSVNEEIVVDDPYDSNAIAQKYINPDVLAGAHNTVAFGTRTDDPKENYLNYTRTVTLQAGDVIYLATSSATPGFTSITITPVAEEE